MEKMKKLFSDKIILIANIVKAITGIFGAAMILQEEHPYWSLTILAIGAGINEFLMYVEKSKNEIEKKKTYE